MLENIRRRHLIFVVLHVKMLSRVIQMFLRLGILVYNLYEAGVAGLPMALVRVKKDVATQGGSIASMCRCIATMKSLFVY